MMSAVEAGEILRQGTIDDVPAVAEIERASFGDPWSESAFRELVKSRAAIFLIAARGASQRVVGYIVALVAAGQAEIVNLAVSPDERRRGFGRGLLDVGIDRLKDRGAREIFLEVRESNAAALALYASRGFSEVGRRRKYYRNPVEDALVLRWAIEG
jgi:[ribosomal protein S18]-alanine N-acetyltransferase